MPFSIIEFGAAGRADLGASFADLHQRDAVFQGQNEPVHAVLSVPVEDRTFWVKRPELKGRLYPAEKKKKE